MTLRTPWLPAFVLLMIALINDGSFDDALPYAESLKNTPEIERISRLDGVRREQPNSHGINRRPVR